jgi:shikimate dehydrogenase
MSARRSLVGLIGANIMGSLSPALHEDAFAAAGIHGYYHLMDLDRLPGRRLEDLLAAVKAAGFDGVNVTFPCKQAVMPLLDEMSPDAQQIGAVNSVTIAASGRTTGYNTDRSGFRGNFEAGLGRGCVEGKTAVLVGAGGAGRAVAFALMDLGAATVLVHDTDMGRASSLVADLARHKGASRARLAGSLTDAVAGAAGVVNATPIGMSGFAGNPVPVEALGPHHWVADVIYTPIETELIKAARAKGARTLTGGGMCVHQAVESFRLFTGRAADIQACTALVRALPRAMRAGANDQRIGEVAMKLSIATVSLMAAWREAGRDRGCRLQGRRDLRERPAVVQRHAHRRPQAGRGPGARDHRFPAVPRLRGHAAGQARSRVCTRRAQIRSDAGAGLRPSARVLERLAGRPRRHRPRRGGPQ